MFGFIKMLQQFIRNLKSNKRLWFTTILVLATGGIILSTFLLISTTNRISQSVYVKQTSDYELHLKSLEKLVERKLKHMAIAFSENEKIVESLKIDDKDTLQIIENTFNAQMKESENNTLLLKLHSAANANELRDNSINASIQTKNNIFGIKVMYDGIFYLYLYPIVEEDKVIGVIEVKQNIYSLKETFSSLNQEYAFLLDSKMLPLLSIQNRDQMSLSIGKNYFLNGSLYDSASIQYLTNLDNVTLQKIAAGDYVLTKEFYLNGIVVRDVNGVDIGLIIMGQKSNQEGSFIDMAQKMTNQVIMIALGLIVSLLLFLF